MWYVYIIRSIANPEHEYTGATEDMKQRMNDHNNGRSAHTLKYMPWKLLWYAPSQIKWLHSSSRNI